MRKLITTDLHLDDKPDNEYMWDLFPWLENAVHEYKVDQLLILGDLTEKKDRHTSALVNRLVRNLTSLSQKVEILILKGNHDYVDPSTPFFSFLSAIKDIDLIVSPSMVGMDLFLPHTSDPAEDWKNMDFDKVFNVYMHQTVEGSIASSGYKLDSIIPAYLFDNIKAKVWSGDVHVPQRVGRVEYIGSPYSVYFGDSFKSRVILTEGKKTSSLHFPSPTKWSLQLKSLADMVNYQIKAGDQVKATVTLDPSEKHEWVTIRSKLRDAIVDSGATVHGLEVKINSVKKTPQKMLEKHKKLSDVDILKKFAEHNKMSAEQLAVGMEFIK